MLKEFCPKCGGKMIDDVHEEIKDLPDGTIQIDTVFPAWVCSNFCGYYERMNNLFNDIEEEERDADNTSEKIGELRELNFSKVIKISEKEGSSSYSFDKYRRNGFEHKIEGFCTSCEAKEYNFSKKVPDYKLSTISHGAHTTDFLEAMVNNKPDTSTWHEQPVMFIFESPSVEDKKYDSIIYNDVLKKPVKEWYWIHKDKRYAEFPEYFEKGKHYGNLVLSMINTFKLKNAYVTNLVKCGLNNQSGQFKGLEDYSSECIHNCFENILKHETNILQPKVVFAFSKSVKGWIKKLAPDLPVYYLPHPAGRIKNRERKLLYFWELTQGLYDTGIINLEEVSILAKKYIRS